MSTSKYKINKRPKDDMSDDNENQDDGDSKGNETELNANQNGSSSKSKPVNMLNNTKDKPGTKGNAVNLGVFKLDSVNCNGTMYAKELCTQLRRILEAHRYFQSLDTINYKLDAEQFCKFIEDNYADNVMEDYQHFMIKHKDNIHKIREIVKSQPSPTSQPATYCGLFEGLHFYLMNSSQSTQDDEKKESSRPRQRHRPRHQKRKLSMVLKEHYDEAPYDENKVEELRTLGTTWYESEDTNVKNLGIYLAAVIDGFERTMNKDLKQGYVKFGAYARIFCECMCIYLLKGDVFNWNGHQCSLSEMIDRLMGQMLKDEFQDEDVKSLKQAMDFVRNNTNKFVHCVAYNAPAKKRFLSDEKKQELFNKISFIAYRLKETMALSFPRDDSYEDEEYDEEYDEGYEEQEYQEDQFEDEEYHEYDD